MKTHIQRVRLLNNSDMPQRLLIIPPSTPNFKIKYSKRGTLPSGIAEEIYVQFTPDGEYRQYSDQIRIHCDSDKFMIPLYAYPVVNSAKLEDLFPSAIDLGSYLKVD